MKNKIIVPVDFSSASRNAFLYAQNLAKDLEATIEVVHSDVYAENNRKTRVKKRKLKERLFDFINAVPSNKGEEGDTLVKPKMMVKVLEGLPERSIVELSKEEPKAILVMGTTGSHNMVERFLGSVSSAIAQHAHCPVILVPNEVEYKGYQNILYASNFEAAAPFPIQETIDFSSLFNAALHFVHVNEKGESDDLTATEERIFQQLFKDGDPSFSFNMASITSKSVMTGLKQYAEENSIDLIVMVNRERDFFASAMGKSLTKKMALNTLFPLMVIHSR